MNEIKLRGAIYLRADSTQVDDAKESIAGQERICRNYCELTDVSVDERHIYRDIAPGNAPASERPGLKALIDAARSEAFDVVVVRRLDRFARNTKLFLALIDELEMNKVRFISTVENFDTTQASGRMMATMLASFSEAEKAILEERRKFAGCCNASGCHCSC